MSVPAQRAVYVLALAQALSASGMMTLTLLGGILGSEFAPAPALATLPVSCTILGLALTTLPAALAMQRFGRRRSFIASALLASVAALVVAWAVIQRDFVLLCLGAFTLGGNLAFQLQHRFAAAECVPSAHVSRAVSIVMVGTLVAAAVGPQFALVLKDLVPGHEYAGSFLGVAGLCLATALTLTAYREGSSHLDHAANGSARPLGVIVRQRDFVTAVLGGVVAYAAMSFIMTATPISMHVHDHHSDSGMTAGLALMLACIGIASGGHDLMHYWWGLVLLGVGWNLMFVAATSLLTTTYLPAERFRVQGVNEFAVFGSQALASLAAGPAIHALDWRTLNLVALMPLAILAMALLRPGNQRSRNSRA